MPFAITSDEQKKQAEQQAQGGANISGASTTFGVNIPGQTAGAKATTPKSSGQYQNIQKYLAANEPQAAEMGQKVAGTVESKIGQAQTAGQALQGEVKAPGTYDPTKVLGNLPGSTEAQKAEYKEQKATGGYTGPTDITGTVAYNPFQKAKTTAQEALGATTTDVGQQQLLGETFARPQYTGGAKALDQSLLARSQGGRSAIESLGQKYSGLTDLLGGYETGAGQAITQAQAQAQANKAAFAPAEQAAQQAIISPIEARAAEANKRAADIAAMQQDVSDLKLSPETLSALGLTSGQRIFDVNLGNYINPALSEANVGNIASAQERQQYNDLLNFLGTNAGQLGLGEPTFQQGTIDQARLAKDIAGRQTALGQQLKQFGGTGNYQQDYANAIAAENQSLSDIQGLNKLLTMGQSGHVDERLLAEMQQKFPMLAIENGPGSISYIDALKDSIRRAQNTYAQATGRTNQINQIGQLYGYNRQVGGL